MKLFASVAATGLAMALIPGAQAEGEDGLKGEGTDVQQVCLYSRDIDNFDALDNDHVYVETRGDGSYLFTMDRSCFGLRSANVIAVSDTSSRICSTSLARISYREVGAGLQYCRVRDIQVVPDKDGARAIVKSRKEEQQNKD